MMRGSLLLSVILYSNIIKTSNASVIQCALVHAHKQYETVLECVYL